MSFFVWEKEKKSRRWILVGLYANQRSLRMKGVVVFISMIEKKKSKWKEKKWFVVDRFNRFVQDVFEEISSFEKFEWWKTFDWHFDWIEMNLGNESDRFHRNHHRPTMYSFYIEEHVEEMHFLRYDEEYSSSGWWMYLIHQICHRSACFDLRSMMNLFCSCLRRKKQQDFRGIDRESMKRILRTFSSVHLRIEMFLEDGVLIPWGWTILEDFDRSHVVRKDFVEFSDYRLNQYEFIKKRIDRLIYFTWFMRTIWIDQLRVRSW